MLDALLHSVLPIFAIVGIGLITGWRGLFTREHASAMNRFLFYVGLPILFFGLMARMRLDELDWPVWFAYEAIEFSLYIGFTLFYRTVLKRSAAEAAVLAMASVFPNHFYYVLPIAMAEYGPDIGSRIILFVATDTLILYFGNMLLLEVLTARAAGGGLRRTAKKIATNPQIITIALGVVAAAISLPLDNGLGRFLDFVGQSAAPLGLFVLGVMLASEKSRSGLMLPVLMSVFSLVIMPLVAYLVTVHALGMPITRVAPLVVTFAGPVGLMPFVLAMQYGQPTGEVARAILFSTLASVITLSIALQILS